MTRRSPRDVSRAGEVLLAASLSLFGLSVAAVRMLAKPGSRVSRWVDDGVRAVGPR